MATRPCNEKRYCFVCQSTRPLRDCEPLKFGDIVKWACTAHELSPTPPSSCPCGRMTANDCAGECGFNERSAHEPAKPGYRVLTEEHLKALEGCLEVADPCEEIAAEATDYGPAQIHAKAVEALNILKAQKRGTIIVYMEGGLVQDVCSDMDLEVSPTVYVVDFDTEGGRSEYSIELDCPRFTDDTTMKREKAQCYEWQGQQDVAAVARLADALARTHDIPAQHGLETPEQKLAREAREYDEASHGADEEDIGSRVYNCPTCEGMYTAFELGPLSMAKLDNKDPRTPAGGCPVCGGVCYDVTQDLKDDEMMAGWSRAFTLHAPTPPQPLDPADTARLNAAIDEHVLRSDDGSY